MCGKPVDADHTGSSAGFTDFFGQNLIGVIGRRLAKLTGGRCEVGTTPSREWVSS